MVVTFLRNLLIDDLSNIVIHMLSIVNLCRYEMLTWNDVRQMNSVAIRETANYFVHEMTEEEIDKHAPYIHKALMRPRGLTRLPSLAINGNDLIIALNSDNVMLIDKIILIMKNTNTKIIWRFVPNILSRMLRRDEIDVVITYTKHQHQWKRLKWMNRLNKRNIYTYRQVNHFIT
jgi:hypothetical protein